MAGFRRLAALALCVALATAPLNAMAQELQVTEGLQTARDLRMAQANPFPQPIGKPQAQPKQGQQASTGNPAAGAGSSAVGNVATVTLPASVSRGGSGSSALKKGDEIRKGDRLQTGAGGSLGVTFDDETSFSLSSNAAITVDDFLYRKGSKSRALVSVTRGTVGFVAAQVAKTGDMKINTPTAMLGIRGTTGVIDVPPGQPTNVKLYPDANGAVGRIEVFGRDGRLLGQLTQAATGLALQLVAQQLSAVPLTISPEQLLRDRNLVQNLFNLQSIGRQLINQRLNQRNIDPRNLPGAPQIPSFPGLPSIPGLPRLP